MQKKKKEKENTEQCGMENQSSDMMQDKLLEQKILFFGSAGVQSKKSFLKSVHNIKWNWAMETRDRNDHWNKLTV